MAATVTPIRKPSAPPDCVLLTAHTSFQVNGVTREFEAGVPITDAADIALLERMDVRRERYFLIPEQQT